MNYGNYDKVGLFHDKFGLDSATCKGIAPRPELPEELHQFRERFMQEELDEFKKARSEGDIVKMFDALIDLSTVTLGYAQLLGLPWEDGFDEVYYANMRKERAQRKEQSERGGTWDIIKPEGWEPPDLAKILRTYGWEV